jgi:glycosyltransferase involved in cell wall biosynthesis
MTHVPAIQEQDMNRRLKVLRVVIGLNQGGVQQAVLNLFNGLDRQKFEPIACAIENTGTIGKEIEAAGFEVIVLGYKRQPLRTIYALVKLMRDRKIDIVHASSYHPSFYARIAALLAGVPVLISHEHVVFAQNRLQRVIFNKLLAPFTDGFLPVGHAVAKQVIDWYGYPEAKVEVIHNGVDTLRFTPPACREEAKRRVGLDPDRPVVGIICRLDPEKGHRFFFDAVKELRSRFDVQWLVVGMGRGEAQVMREAKERSVDDVVRFLGMRRDVPDLLAAFDCYVLPTLQEGFPNSVLEAMSAGCPVVVSDFPGNLEVVPDGVNGLVAPMGDSVTLTRHIEALLMDSGLRARLAVDARRHIEENFSIKQNVDKTAALYERLWNRKKRGR